MIDGNSSRRRALCGGNIAEEACKQGWEGMVFNGVVRDSHETMIMDIGIKSLGTSAMPPSNEMDGVTGDTLTFGGIQFRPGEYLYADQDCVIVLENPDHD